MTTPSIPVHTLKGSGDYCVRPPNAGTPEGDWQLISPDGQPVIEVNRFLHTVGLRGLRARTLRAYAYDLLCALRWMRMTDRYIADISAESLLDFIEYQRQSPPAAAATINRRLEVLQRLAAFVTGKHPAGVTWLCAGPMPTRRGRRAFAVRVRTAHPLITPLTDQAALTFFDTLNTARDRAITLLMWVTGLRSCEILNLTLVDVDFQAMSLKIIGKGLKERVMPLAETVSKVMLQYLTYERPARASSQFFVVLKNPHRGQPMTYSGLHRIFRYHRATSQILNANPHRFRHTFGANMTRCRVPLAILAKMMGHSSPQTTLRYIQLNDQDVRQQYEDAIKTLNASNMVTA
ncbi:MAG: tyrosine-type recombinase/integrase [Methylococcaceae bacterium]